MQLSHTRPTKRDISAHSRSLIHPSTLSNKRELVMLQITPPSSCTPRDSKISQSSKELETSSEFTELLSDFTMVRDNSMPTFSTAAHGLSSQLTRNQLLKRSVVMMPLATLFPSVTLVKMLPLRRARLPLFKTSESGLNNTSQATQLFQTTCSPH